MTVPQHSSCPGQLRKWPLDDLECHGSLRYDNVSLSQHNHHQRSINSHHVMRQAANEFINSDRQGTQGQHDGASNATLDNEFGTHSDDEVITLILEKGNLQESEVCFLGGNDIPPFTPFEEYQLR